MEMMNEKVRKKMILEAHKFGGISLRHQLLRVHKNGAKFPISKVYVDDGLLDPGIKYTLVLIPEIKIATKTTVTLSYFQRKKGFTIFYSYPEDVLKEEEKEKLADVVEALVKEGFITYQSSIISSLNYYFEIPSEWARGKKELVMISVMLNIPINQKIEKIIQTICVDFVSKLKNNRDFFKALYNEDINLFPEEEHSNIKKISASLRSIIKETYEKVKISTRQKTK